MRILLVMLILAMLGIVDKPVAVDSYVLRLGDSITINGNVRHASSRIEKRYGKSFFWFERDGQAYVVTDAKVLERAHAVVAPQAELGTKQAELGRKQAALGQKQAALGAKQAAAGRNADLHEALSRQQEALGREQEALGEQQEALGREQERLGCEVERRLSELADECIGNGLAKKTTD